MTRPRIAWLISYDITEPRRLGRVHRFLRDQAFPVQYSVFLAVLDERQLGRVLTGLARLIQPGSDDVRAYPLPSIPQIEAIGSGARLADVLPAAAGWPAPAPPRD